MRGQASGREVEREVEREVGREAGRERRTHPRRRGGLLRFSLDRDAAPLHGHDTQRLCQRAFGDAGYQGAHKRADAQPAVDWHVAMPPGKRAALDKSKLLDPMTDEVERIKARIRAKVEHPLRLIKSQFGFVKVRYRGLTKNTAQLTTLFALI